MSRRPHPTATLVGTIEYRLKLDDGISTANSSKKWRRDQGSTGNKNGNTSEKNDQWNDATLSGKKRSRSAGGDTSSASKSTYNWVHNAGYFFVPVQSSEQCRGIRSGSSSTGYPILYPFALIDTICKAAVTGDPVNITRYRWTKFDSPDCDHVMNTDTGAGSNSQGASNDASEFSVRVLEVHRGGIRIIPGNSTNSETSQIDPQQDEKPKNLTEFAILENERRSTGKSSQGTSSTEQYSIVAKIDATSAIIAAVPSDPFALVELYEEVPGDDDRAPLSAVAVLRGRSALAVHEALHPGRTVIFKRVRRQRWHVPKSFEDVKLGVAARGRLKDRAPTHVFVVDNGRSISLSLTDDGDEELESIRTDHFPPLPSTAVPLHAIQGEVVSIRRASMGGAREAIHSVLIDCIDSSDLASGERCKLYMTYFPVTPGFIFRLRVGAMIRAVNVHSINPGVWPENRATGRVMGASARSTVFIMDTTSDIRTKESTTPFLSGTRCKPFSFISVRRTYDEMEWRERLRTVWYDKSGLAADSDAPRFEDLSRNLLAQYETSTSKGVIKGKCHGNEVNKSLRKTKAKRDPYVEFFDQPFEANATEDEKRPVTPHFPIVLPLKSIRDACIGRLKSFVKSTCVANSSDFTSVENQASLRSRTPVKSGWTASKSFDERILRQILMDAHSDDCAPSSLYACGIAGEKLSSIRDGFCQLPVCLAFDEDDPSHVRTRLQASCGMNIERGTFLALPIHSVVVSCICLGPKPKDSSPGDVAEYLPAPTAQVTGGCALFVVSDLLFIASAHIRWVGPQTVINAEAGNKVLKSVRDSVEGTSSIAKIDARTLHSNTFVVGRLVRHRFALRKLQHGTYKGCVLTLSHVPLTGSNKKGNGVDASACPCDLQSIELRLSANDIPNEATGHMRQALRLLFRGLQDIDQHGHHAATSIVSHMVTDDQIGLATSWWILAEDARFSPLLCGGRDESQTREGLLSSTYLRFPLASRETSSLGYRRFKSSFEDVVAFSVRSSAEKGDDVCTPRSLLEGTVDFDFVGGEKFLPGMLDRLPERNGWRHRTGDRLILPPEIVSGIPTHTLAQLHWNICQDLNHKSRTSTAPSLVRRITGARLLGVTFCRAQAECTRCFQFLCQRGHRSHETRQEAKSGVVTSVRVSTKARDDDSEDTFWHLPMDFEGCDGPSPSPKPRGSRIDDRMCVNKMTIPTNLRCPNDCPIDFAAIKWECSGVVDDGTGQAKLHAERDAALALIGSGLNVERVEDGAWAVESGITYQRSVPPNSFIRNAVREAQMMARQIARDNPEANKKIVRASDVLRLLTPEAKAIYTMQRHCRFSKEPLRSIDIVCRCKPISDVVEDLNRTDVDVTIARCEERQEAIVSDAITSTLPPLKLNLVDICAVQRMKRDEGWSLVRALTGR